MNEETKLTFKQWIAKEENTTFEWAHNLVNDLVNVPSHKGDCTKDNHTVTHWQPLPEAPTQLLNPKGINLNQCQKLQETNQQCPASPSVNILLEF